MLSSKQDKRCLDYIPDAPEKRRHLPMADVYLNLVQL